MRRFWLLLLLCVGITGTAAPMAAAPLPAMSHTHGMAGTRHCGGDAACVHGACLGCALEPDTGRPRPRPPIVADAPAGQSDVTTLASRPFPLDPPPPRRG